MFRKRPICEYCRNVSPVTISFSDTVYFLPFTRDGLENENYQLNEQFLYILRAELGQPASNYEM